MTLRLGVPDRRQRNRGCTGEEPGRTELVQMILGSFWEMPGLSVRADQAARLFGVRLRTCEVVLQELVRDGRLTRAADGRFRAN